MTETYRRRNYPTSDDTINYIVRRPAFDRKIIEKTIITNQCRLDSKTANGRGAESETRRILKKKSRIILVPDCRKIDVTNTSKEPRIREKTTTSCTRLVRNLENDVGICPVGWTAYRLPSKFKNKKTVTVRPKATAGIRFPKLLSRIIDPNQTPTKRTGYAMARKRTKSSVREILWVLF